MVAFALHGGDDEAAPHIAGVELENEGTGVARTNDAAPDSADLCRWLSQYLHIRIVAAMDSPRSDDDVDFDIDVDFDVD